MANVSPPTWHSSEPNKQARNKKYEILSTKYETNSNDKKCKEIPFKVLYMTYYRISL